MSLYILLIILWHVDVALMSATKDDNVCFTKVDSHVELSMETCHVGSIWTIFTVTVKYIKIIMME